MSLGQLIGCATIVVGILSGGDPYYYPILPPNGMGKGEYLGIVGGCYLVSIVLILLLTKVLLKYTHDVPIKSNPKGNMVKNSKSLARYQ